VASFNKFNVTVANLGLGVHNLNTDSLLISLQNVAPVATNTVFANLTEISAGNGYSAGGTAIGSTAYSQTSGLASLTGNNVVFTASGGTIGPLRYATLYDATPTSPLKPLIGWWDYGSSITLNAGETLTVSFTTNLILTLQ
jgi:hypothetical protein